MIGFATQGWQPGGPPDALQNKHSCCTHCKSWIAGWSPCAGRLRPVPPVHANPYNDDDYEGGESPAVIDGGKKRNQVGRSQNGLHVSREAFQSNDVGFPARTPGHTGEHVFITVSEKRPTTISRSKPFPRSSGPRAAWPCGCVLPRPPGRGEAPSVHPRVCGFGRQSPGTCSPT